MKQAAGKESAEANKKIITQGNQKSEKSANITGDDFRRKGQIKSLP